MFCPKCGLVVAPYDPMRVKVGDRLFHGNCRAKDLKEQREKEQATRKVRQQYFRFNSWETIH
jgi:hypothetical protein